MSGPTANQTYHLILADIAMAAALSVHDSTWLQAASDQPYTPGAIRDRWLAADHAPPLRRMVSAMATAGVASLQSVPGERLLSLAETYGVPLDAATADALAAHFVAKQDAFLSYTR